MKDFTKIIYTLLCFFFFSLSVFASPEIKSEYAILINLDEDKVLYEKNSQEKTPMASLTKIMTAIVALENITDINETVTLKNEDFIGLASANAAVAGFRVGENVTYKDLLYGLLLPSGADAANALTRNVSGSLEAFVAKMNEKVEQLGLTKTHFENVTGLDSENHYTTAEEMSKIFQYAIQNPIFKTIIETPRYTMSNQRFSVVSTVTKNIERIGLALDYILGGKTGTTDDAGLCLASLASFNGVNYMLITIKAPQEGKRPNNFYDAKSIYDYFMENFQNQVVLESGEKILTLNTQYARENEISFYSEETWTKYLPKTFSKDDLKLEYMGENIITYNTKPGTKLGTVNVYYQEELLKNIEIILNTELHFDILKYMNTKKAEIISISLILLIIALLLIKRREKRKRVGNKKTKNKK